MNPLPIGAFVKTGPGSPDWIIIRLQPNNNSCNLTRGWAAYITLTPVIKSEVTNYFIVQYNMKYCHVRDTRLMIRV